MNTPYQIPKKLLSNLLKDELFLFKNIYEDTFLVMDSVDSEDRQDYLLGFTVQYRFQDQDVLKLLITFMVNNYMEGNSFNINFVPFDNGKLFEVILDDESNAVSGMNTEETESFINEHAVLPVRVQQLVISKMYGMLSENRI